MEKKKKTANHNERELRIKWMEEEEGTKGMKIRRQSYLSFLLTNC